MAKSPRKADKGKVTVSKPVKPARAQAAAKSAPAIVKKQAKAAGGNGNRVSQQALLDLDAPDVAANTPPSTQNSQPAAAPTAAAPVMRELGLSAKEAWKVDLRGKRVVLDEKGWREELARALGRVPAKS